MIPVKCAVIGLGKMGLLHGSILSAIPNVEIVAVCEKSSILLRIAKRLFPTAELVDDIAKLDGSSISTAYVTTPITSHFGIINYLLSHQIVDNIFVEKTLASSWEKSRNLCKLVQNSPGVMMVGYMKRYSVTFRKAKQLLAQNVLGKISSFDAYAFSSDFAEAKHGSKKPALRGGVLRDLGSHIIDLTGWFFGDFEVASASLEAIVSDTSEDAANFVAEVKNLDMTGNFQISWCAKKHRMPIFGISILGDKGIMKVDDYSLNLKLSHGSNVSYFKHDLDDSVGFLLGEPEYYREDFAFIEAISSGKTKDPEPSFVSASRTDYIIDQIKKEADRIRC